MHFSFLFFCFFSLFSYLIDASIFSTDYVFIFTQIWHLFSTYDVGHLVACQFLPFFKHIFVVVIIMGNDIICYAALYRMCRNPLIFISSVVFIFYFLVSFFFYGK